MSPEDYCQDRATPRGSSLYYSLLALPLAQRRSLATVYAFCREVTDIVDECHDVGVAHTKLDWWREELNRLFLDRPQHPVSQALAPHLDRFNLPREYFQEIIDGVEMAIDLGAYPNFKELSLYCYRLGSIPGLLAAEILGYTDRRTLSFTHTVGTFLQLVKILRDVGKDALRGRFYLPEDELKRFNVRPSELAGRSIDGRLQELLEFQAARVKMYHERAFAQLPEQDRYRQRSHIILAELSMTLLEEIETDGFRVTDRRITLTPLRKFWIAWRTHHRERRRHRRYLATG